MKVYAIKNLNGEYGRITRLGIEWSNFLSDASLFIHKEVIEDHLKSQVFTQPLAIVECELKEIETLPNDEYEIEMAKKILREHNIAFKELAE